MMRFAALLLAIVAPLPVAAQPPLQTYSHPNCRYSFAHFAGWHVEPGGDPEHPCEVRAQSPDASVVVWADAGRGGFEGALTAAGFVRVDDAVKRWWAKQPDLVDGAILVFGRSNQITKTSEIHVGALHGLRANEVLIECYGQPPGGRLCSRDMAFLTNGRQWVSFEAPAHSDWLELALRSAVVTPPPLATYTHPTCGFSFQYLADSTVTPSDEEGDCDVEVRASPTDAVHLDIGDGGFEEGAHEVSIFHMKEEMAPPRRQTDPPLGSWVAFGKGAWSPTLKIEFGSLRGLRADNVPYRMHNEHGNAGLAWESRAFLTDGRRWVVVAGDTGTDNFDLILESVRLSP